MLNGKIIKRVFLSSGILLLILSGIFISFFFRKAPPPEITEEVYKIKKPEKIRMITDNNATSYYIYRDMPMGFEYELAKAFSDYLGAELEIITPGWDALFESLNSGKGDFIASGLTITEERQKSFLFSQPYMTIQQKFIHHNLKFGIKNLRQLTGKTIHIRQGTSYQERLEEIKKEGIDFNIELLSNISTEEILRKIHNKEIKYTIADSNIALLNYRNVHTGGGISWMGGKKG